jgi:dihydrofolate reductase
MTFVTSHVSVSLDGFVAGPDQSQENPLGIDGIKLHHWHLDNPKHPVDDAFTRRLLGTRGAYIMGRNMFGPVRGEWGQSDWRGWWGPEPPYHAPVIVLTHYAHDPIEMEGGTVFHFVDSFDSAWPLPPSWPAIKQSTWLVAQAPSNKRCDRAVSANWCSTSSLSFSVAVNVYSSRSRTWRQNRWRWPLRPSPPTSSTESNLPRRPRCTCRSR